MASPLLLGRFSGPSCCIARFSFSSSSSSSLSLSLSFCVRWGCCWQAIHLELSLPRVPGKQGAVRSGKEVCPALILSWGRIQRQSEVSGSLLRATPTLCQPSTHTPVPGPSPIDLCRCPIDFHQSEFYIQTTSTSWRYGPGKWCLFTTGWEPRGRPTHPPEKSGRKNSSTPEHRHRL